MSSSSATYRDALEPGTDLNGYSIDTIVGGGGFGVVYRARHKLLRGYVAIKEYLPLELAVRHANGVHPREGAGALFREGLRRFVNEGRLLVGFRDDPAIVSCRDLFEANGTAYLVMEYEDAQPLSELLHSRESQGQFLGEKELLDLMIPLTESLERVHASSVLHRDIKPSNILVRRNGGQPVLIDFGAAKQNVAVQTKSLAPLTPGYAALEQVAEGDLGPWTDLYGLGAVMWRIVAGASGREPLQPVSAETRAYAVLQGKEDPLLRAHLLGQGRYSPLILAMIEKCLELNEKERIRDSSELLALLRLAGAGQFAPETEGNTPFHNAAHANHPRAIEVLCRVGGELDAKNKLGETALHVASQADHLAAVQALLQADADITARDRSGNTPMHAAARGGAVMTINALAAADAEVDAANNDEHTALYLAARASEVTATKALVAAGADANAPLHTAARAGQAAAIEGLLAVGAEIGLPDDDGYSALHLAAREGHTTAIKTLIEWGADPNDGDDEAETPFVLAAKAGHLAATKALVEAGLSPVSFGLPEPSPLHWAARRGDVAIISVLLAAGADVFDEDEDGNTPLHWAAEAGQAAVIETLVAGGAIVWARNKFSDATPLHLAAKSGSVATIDALVAGRR